MKIEINDMVGGVCQDTLIILAFIALLLTLLKGCDIDRKYDLDKLKITKELNELI